MGDIEFGGMRGINSLIDDVVKGFGETGKIVRDIYNKLEEFKTEIDANIKKDLKAKIEELTDKLFNRLKATVNLSDQSRQKIEQVIDDVKHQLSGGI